MLYVQKEKEENNFRERLVFKLLCRLHFTEFMKNRVRFREDRLLNKHFVITHLWL